MRAISVFRVFGSVVLAAASTALPPAAADSSNEPFVFEELSSTYRFEVDGTAKVETFARIRVQSEAGVQQLGQLLFPYVEDREALSMASLRVLAGDGTVKHEAAAMVQTLPAPVTSLFPLYTDLKILHVTVPSFRAGDVLEYRLSKDLHSPEAPGEFWLEYAFQRQAIVEAETLVVDVPSEVDVRLRDAGQVKGEEALEPEGRRVWTWHQSHLERESEEEEKPGDWDLELSSFGSWSELGGWYQGLRGDRARPTEAVRAKAAELVAGAQEPRESLEALFTFVSSQFRYLGLLFGLGRYQPHLAEEILESGYGDCKDKHTLLAALARSEGFEVSAVLIGALREELEEEVPSPAQFDHALTAVKVEGDWVYLDTTSGVAPFGYLPPHLRGKRALRVPESGESELVTMPESLPFATRMETWITGEADNEGTLTADVSLKLRGDSEWFMRVAFQNSQAAQWLDMARSLVSLDFDTVASHLELSELSDTSRSLEVSFEIEAEHWLDMSKPEQELAAALPSMKSGLRSWEDLAEDDGTVEIGGPVESWLISEIDLPWGFEVDVPVNVEMALEALGEYSASYSFGDGLLVAERRISFGPKELGPEAEAGYTSLRATVRKDHDQEFRLVREAAVAELETSEDPAWLYGVGQARIDEDPAAALAAFERVVALDPDYPWGWYEVGRASEKLEDYEGAREAFREQGVVDPFNRKTFDAEGRMSERLGDTEGASAAYRRQLENDPLHEGSTRQLGRLLAEEERCAEATDPLRRALAFDTEDCRSRQWLGRCLLELERIDEAWRALSAFDGCSHEQLMWAGAYCASAGQHDLAAALSREVLRLAPNDAEAATLLLGGLLKQDRYEELVEVAKELLEDQPENADLYTLLAAAHLRLGRRAKMLEQLEKVVELQPKDIVTRRAVVHLYMETGELKPAIRHLEEIVRQAPASDTALSTLGGLLYQKGDLDGAEAALSRAVVNDSADHGFAATTLGRLYAGMERYKEAQEMLEIAKRKAGGLFTDQDLLDHVVAQALGTE